MIAATIVLCAVGWTAAHLDREYGSTRFVTLLILAPWVFGFGFLGWLLCSG